MCDCETYLELSEDPVRFEAINQLTNVFFDDSNKQVFAVRSGGVMGVVVKGPTETSQPFTFRMEDHGSLVSIKFNSTKTILAVQRTNVSVQFMNYNGETFDTEYSQLCKKNSNILGFVWSQPNEIAFITDHGLELYLVIPEKRSLKLIKTHSVAAQWFVWCPVTKTALLASEHGSQLNPVTLKPGNINKLPKIETEANRMTLERDITLATLYSTPALLILRHHTSHKITEVQVHVYLLDGSLQTYIKRHVLNLGQPGRFAINVVDDLVIVHHQVSKTSQLFDIALPGESDGVVTYHSPVAPARSLKPTSLLLPSFGEAEPQECELYSPHWVVFQPNIIIDAKLGCLWYVKLSLKHLLHQIQNLETCTQLALKRTGAKPVLLELLLEKIRQPKLPLEQLQKSFNCINKVYHNWAEAELQAQMANLPSTSSKGAQLKPRVLIDQNDMYNEIFQVLDEEEELEVVERILICYITSLLENNIIAHNVNELIIMTLVRRKKFTAMLQLLQYGVVPDSKPLACLLLSLSNVHQQAAQLALDMLHRLDAKDEIQEILISLGDIIPALKLAGDKANPRKYLQAAKATGDPAIFHSVYYHFMSKPHFASMMHKDERLRKYIQYYKDLFSDDPK